MKRNDYITPCTDLLRWGLRSAVLTGSIELPYGGSEEEGTADTHRQDLWFKSEE